MIGPGTTGAPCPALTPLLTFKPRATVWLWFAPSIPPGVPAFTCVFIFTVVFPFLENTKSFVRSRFKLASIATPDADIAVGFASFDVGFDFHTYGFLS
jgi:hypothetical protein